MQVIQAPEDLHQYQASLRFGQTLHLLKVGVQISMRTVLQPEDNVVLGLEGIEQIDQVFVFDRKQYVFLVFKHFGLLHCCYCVLPDKFESTVLII